MDKKTLISCKYCAQPIDDQYLINQRGDYFCGDDCHEVFHHVNEHEFHESDEDHPYYFDYSTIRRQYIYWTENWEKLLQEETKDSNEYAQQKADALIDELEGNIWAYEHYIKTEGDDGVFAYEIYQYIFKLSDIQQQMLQWRPERETYYVLQHFYDYGNAATFNLITTYLNDITQKQGATLIECRNQRTHSFNNYFDWIFDFEQDRDDWYERLAPYFNGDELDLDRYSSHSCDGGCGDFMNKEDNYYWSNGWFYCESCLQDKDVGELTINELKKQLYHYEINNNALQNIIHNKYGEYDQFKSLIRRACRVHLIEIPDWAIDVM